MPSIHIKMAMVAHVRYHNVDVARWGTETGETLAVLRTASIV